MHWLWIVFGGEGQNFLSADVARSKCAETAKWKIFKGEGYLAQFGLSAPRRSPIVAALSGNLNT
jgi:hypothetical protein